MLDRLERSEIELRGGLEGFVESTVEKGTGNQTLDSGNLSEVQRHREVVSRGMGVLGKNMIARFSKRAKLWKTKLPLVLKGPVAIEAFSV